MKRIFFTLCLIICGCVYADEPVKPIVQQSTVVSQPILFENCSKIFGVEREKLFYLTLASISANKYTIDEIQSTNGYIIFNAHRNKYIATIAKVDAQNSILKITPCNNTYSFPPSVLTNTFRFIDLNLDKNIKF